MLYPTCFLVFFRGEELSLFISYGDISNAIIFSKDQFSDFIDISLLWRKSYLQSLQTRQKWTTPQKNLEEGDIVILKDEGVPRNLWKLARVEATYPDALFKKCVITKVSPIPGQILSNACLCPKKGPID